MHPPFIPSGWHSAWLTVDPGIFIKRFSSTPLQLASPSSCHHVELKQDSGKGTFSLSHLLIQILKCHFIFTQAGAFTAEIIAFPCN